MAIYGAPSRWTVRVVRGVMRTGGRPMRLVILSAAATSLRVWHWTKTSFRRISGVRR